MVSQILTTVFLPLSGRHACWLKLADFLSRMEIDREETKVYLLDTSNDPSFTRLVDEWVQKTDFPRVHHVRHVVHAEKRLADKPRTQYFADVNHVMVDIYRYAQDIVEGTRLFVIEDDVIPPIDAFTRLNWSLNDDPRNFSVSGAYWIRGQAAWTAWRDTREEITEAGNGVEAVMATGFGCVVMDAARFRDMHIRWIPQGRGKRKWPWGYDMEFFTDVNKQGFRTLIDWNVQCQHLTKNGEPWYPPSTAIVRSQPPPPPDIDVLLDQ